MGTNVLNSLKELFQKPTKLQIGTVESTSEGRCVVRLSTDATVSCWGSYSSGDSVYIKDGQILGKIKKEVPTVVYI